MGEVVRRTGLTVRTLHHYDEIGLLKPSLHTEAGYRLYTDRDVVRLQQVISLRQLGLSLQEVRACLDRPDVSPLGVINLHLAHLRAQVESQRRLCGRLEAIAAHLRAAGEVSADELLNAIEEMTRMETYFTPEQLDLIRERREEIGGEQLRRKQQEWAELIALIRGEMERGTDPGDAKVQALARRWQDLVDFTTGGDPEMARSIKRHWEEQGDAIVAQHGAEYDSRPVWGYMDRALAFAKGSTAAAE